MKITVVVATHKRYRMPSDSCYFPLHVGRAGGKDIGYPGDDTGDNISYKNPYYCELTGLYWMWKNISSDYVGLVHYRRYFTTKSGFWRLGKRDRFSWVMKEAEIRSLLKQTDIILPKKRRYFIESLYSHYAHTHYREHLDITQNIIRRQCPDYEEAFKRVMRRTGAHMFNMFIMSKEKCSEYCQWLFPILEELEHHIDINDYNTYQARLYGRVSEMMLDVWLTKNRYAYKEVPVLNMEKLNWGKKIKAFLVAKLFGKKYSGSF